MIGIKDEIEKSVVKTIKIAIILPGISGGVRSKPIYDLLSDKIRSIGIDIYRANIWVSETDIEKLSIKEIVEKLNYIIQELNKLGYKEFCFIGKSFGGAMGLLLNNDLIKKMVLWAPAINFGKDSNIKSNFNEKLSNFANFNEIKINSNDLTCLKSNILIIQGTSDNIVSLENSKAIASSSNKFSLIEIDGADHSYNKKEWMEEVIAKTIKFLA